MNGIERCIDDEIPFEIPDNWCWVRLDDLVVKSIKRGKSPKYCNRSKISVFAQKCNTKAGHIDMTLAKFLEPTIFEKYPEEEYLVNNDLIINSTGNGTLGRIGLFNDNDRINNNIIVPDSHITVVRINSLINVKFIFYTLKYYQPFLEKYGEGSTNQTELKGFVISNLLIPIPPFNEQNRVVNCIEKTIPNIQAL